MSSLNAVNAVGKSGNRPMAPLILPHPRPQQNHAASLIRPRHSERRAKPQRRSRPLAPKNTTRGSGGNHFPQRRPQRIAPPPSKSTAKSKKSVTPPSCKSECSFAIIHTSGKSSNPQFSPLSGERPLETGAITPLAQPPEIQVKNGQSAKSQSARVVPTPLSRRGLPPQGIELQPACCLSLGQDT